MKNYEQFVKDLVSKRYDQMAELYSPDWFDLKNIPLVLDELERQNLLSKLIDRYSSECFEGYVYLKDTEDQTYECCTFERGVKSESRIFENLKEAVGFKLNNRFPMILSSSKYFRKPKLVEPPLPWPDPKADLMGFLGYVREQADINQITHLEALLVEIITALKNGASVTDDKVVKNLFKMNEADFESLPGKVRQALISTMRDLRDSQKK